MRIVGFRQLVLIVALAALVASQTVAARVPFHESRTLPPDSRRTIAGRQLRSGGCLGRRHPCRRRSLVRLRMAGRRRGLCVQPGGRWLLADRRHIGGSRPGSSLRISGRDRRRTRIVVGAPWDDEVEHGAGAAFVFVRLDGEYQLEAKGPRQVGRCAFRLLGGYRQRDLGGRSALRTRQRGQVGCRNGLRVLGRSVDRVRGSRRPGRRLLFWAFRSD